MSVDLSADLKAIADIERELNIELPVRPVGKYLPKEVRSKYRPIRKHIKSLDKLDYHGMTNGICIGCFTDPHERVIGLALCLLDLYAVPKPVLRLKHLIKLNLGQNLLTEFPEELGVLPVLDDIQLFGNFIRTIPESVFKWSIFLPRVSATKETMFKGDDFERGIWLENNPIESPPQEIIEQGSTAVLAYFREIELEEIALNEAKVLFVGDGGAGKTCLVKRVLYDIFNPRESQTDGIKIDTLMIGLDGIYVKLNLWDFGGQEIMHATHQFFLSERSLYVLVLDGRKEDEAEYWLKLIETFGGISPILVVLNKVDENPGFDVNHRFLKAKHPSLIDFYRVSCSTGIGIDQFKEGMVEALKKVEIIRTGWPTTWHQVKSKLEVMTQPFISYDQYRDMCVESGINAPDSQDVLVKFLNDLGIIVHFDDFQLKELHVLEPRWLTEAVYRIINSEELVEGKGILRLEQLPQILKRRGKHDFYYPTNVHPYIVALMRKFEICYSIDESTILAPDLLEIQEPEIYFDFDSSLRFRIDYDFLPKSVIARFIVRRNSEIDGMLRWRTGVVLKNEDFAARVVVRVDESAKQILVYVDGDRCREYLTVIRSTFLEINRSYEKLQYWEKVPLPDNPEIAVGYQHLLQLEKEGRAEVYPEGATHPYVVKELLGTLFIESKPTEDDLIQILEAVVRSSQTEQGAMSMAMNIIQLQPNFMGLGVNVNEIVKRLWNKLRSR